MSFQKNNFQTYRATTKIHLGKYEMDIMEDDQFDYDGFTLRYGGVEYGVPQLRGLVGDWFVPVADQYTQYVSKPAGVQVSHATPEARERGDSFTMSEASEEEAVVGTLGEQQAIRKAASQGAQGADRLAELRAQRETRKRNLAKTGRAGGTGEIVTDTNPHAPPPQNASDVDDDLEQALMGSAREQMQDTRSFRQAVPARMAAGTGGNDEAVARANAINAARIAQKAAELEARDPRKTREEMGMTTLDVSTGITAEETHRRAQNVGPRGKYAVISDDSGGVPVGKSYQFSGGAAVGPEGVAGDAPRVNVLKAGRSQPVQVGRAVASTPQNREAGAMIIPDVTETHEPQAVRARQTTQIPAKGNVGIDQMLPGGHTGDVDVTRAGDSLGDLLPDAAVAGSVATTPRKRFVPPPQPSEADEIQEIVKTWSTHRRWQVRVQEAVDYYGDWPEALDAICAKESEKVAAQIRSKVDKAAVAAST